MFKLIKKHFPNAQCISFSVDGKYVYSIMNGPFMIGGTSNCPSKAWIDAYWELVNELKTLEAVKIPQPPKKYFFEYPL